MCPQAPRGISKAFKKAIKTEEAVSKEQLAARRVVTATMMNPIRQQVFQYLFERPCSTASMIAAAIGISHNTVRWHLIKLAESDYISSTQVGNKRIFYPRELIEREDLELLYILQDRAVKSVLKYISDFPGACLRDIAKATAISVQTAIEITQGLEKAGVLTVVQNGKFKRHFITDLIAQRRDAYRKRVKAYKTSILRRLSSEGLRPTVMRSTDDKLIVELFAGSKKSALSFALDPFELRD